MRAIEPHKINGFLMVRHLLISVFMSMAAASSVLSQSNDLPGVDPEKIAASTADDFELNRNRLLCAEDQMPSQTPHKACRYVLDEVLERHHAGRSLFIGDLYIALAGSAENAEAEFNAIKEAIGNGETNYVSTRTKKVKPIPCTLAYDAGYADAVQYPETAKTFQKALNLTDEQVDAYAKLCFDQENPATPGVGYNIGVIHASKVLERLQ